MVGLLYWEGDRIILGERGNCILRLCRIFFFFFFLFCMTAPGGVPIR